MQVQQWHSLPLLFLCLAMYPKMLRENPLTVSTKYPKHFTFFSRFMVKNIDFQEVVPGG